MTKETPFAVQTANGESHYAEMYFLVYSGYRDVVGSLLGPSKDKGDSDLYFSVPHRPSGHDDGFFKLLRFL